MQVGCYTLDLYCDEYSEAPGANNAMQSSERLHVWGEFPHQYTGETGGECRKKARKQGWKLGKRGEKDYCPKCAAAKRQKKATVTTGLPVKE